MTFQISITSMWNYGNIQFFQASMSSTVFLSDANT